MARAVEHASWLRDDASARREQRQAHEIDNDDPANGVALEPLYERYIDRKSGVEVVIPIARTARPTGRISLAPLPPIFGANIRKGAPMRRALPRGASIVGHDAGPGYVWAGHLQKCVDEDTGEVYYVPVVYIVELAARPNNLPVVR